MIPTSLVMVLRCCPELLVSVINVHLKQHTLLLNEKMNMLQMISIPFPELNKMKMYQVYQTEKMYRLYHKRSASNKKYQAISLLTRIYVNLHCQLKMILDRRNLLRLSIRRREKRKIYGSGKEGRQTSPYQLFLG